MTNPDDQTKYLLSQGTHMQIKLQFIREKTAVRLQREGLSKAAQAGDIKTVQSLIDNGADIHSNSEQALILASASGQTEIVKLLLNLGADIHSNNDEPLRGAVWNDQPETVLLLISKGANVHSRRCEALFQAASNHYNGIVRILLENGSSPRAYHSRALKAAAEAGNIEALHLFVTECECDPNIVLNYDSSANESRQWCESYIANQEFAITLDDNLSKSKASVNRIKA